LGKVNILSDNSFFYIGKHRIHLTEVTSTNELAKQLLEENLAFEGTTISADFQTNGKGQEATVWESEKGKNMLSTLILQPEWPVDKQVYFNLSISLSVFDWVKNKCPNERVCIKWPNDVYVNDCKVAGILIENSLNANYIKQSIIGVGVNINQLQFVTPHAASIATFTHNQYDVAKCIDEWNSCLAKRYAQLKLNDFNTLWNEYHEVFYKGGQQQWFMINGKEVSAIIQGIDEHGRLLLWIENAEQGKQTVAYNVKEVKWILNK
jgi:BirA family transcriptional regulator, biotin operon repressor / biotin---[acetyl-CoA-carboxylase] ligase